MKSKKIRQVLVLARVYLEEGMNYTEAVKKAEEDVEEMKRNKYESKI